MAPIAKETEVQNSAAPASTTSATQPRVQPVALEIAVTVNGARTVEGSAKREPFSETTRTVLVFGNGAVIRLTSAVAAGQLLFVTNEKSKKEVVCQVVKSKNYSSASGYVELEFTEPAVGFWGMRFPGDRPSAAVPIVSAPVGVAPVKPMPVAISGEAKTVLPVQETKQETKRVTSAPVVSAQPAAVPPTPSASDELRKEAARLQEKFSSMQFAETSSPKPEGDNQTAASSSMAETTAKVIEFAKADPTPAAKPLESFNLAPASQTQKSSGAMHDEEVKIPSWLEPLARNAASQAPAAVPPPVAPPAPAPMQVVPLTAEPVENLTDTAVPATGELHGFGNPVEAAAETFETGEVTAPNFGSDLLQSTGEIASEPASGSKKGLWIGLIAATLVLAAGGGWWYTQQSSSAATKITTEPLRPQLVEPAATNTEPQQKYLASTSIPAASKPFSSPSPVTPQADSTQKAALTPATEVQKIPNAHDAAKPTAAPMSTAGKSAEPVEETRKSTFNQMRLAAPKIKRGGTSQVSNESEPGIAMENATAGGAAPLTSGLAGSHGNQPAAPIVVGGEVKPVQLISSVPPQYPQLARTQRISGDVKIDALIDENGRVTAMKVLSGPVLLHQAAMDSLHQWKYRPATLNGKAESMHLVVTVQFRLQ